MATKKFEGNKKVFTSEDSAVKHITKEKKTACFDCGCEIALQEEEMQNGSLVVYEDEGKDIFVFKCDTCFSSSPELVDYKKCEVYSRIVGYLRPVNQWNEGKKQEYLERKEYTAFQS